jgi:nucleotide-binding universal stress UspA family protein
VNNYKEFSTKERTMFERVLLAVDGSKHSERAISVASELAQRFGSEVLVLNIREVVLTTRSGPIEKESPKESLSLVKKVAERLVRDGVNARGESAKVVQSGPAKEILDVAKEFEANLIVMGTRGHSELTGLLLGSVASKVLRHAKCPVTVVR